MCVRGCSGVCIRVCTGVFFEENFSVMRCWDWFRQRQ